MRYNKAFFLLIFSISFYACSNKKDTTAELEVIEASPVSTAELEVIEASPASTVELGVIEEAVHLLLALAIAFSDPELRVIETSSASTAKLGVSDPELGVIETSSASTVELGVIETPIGEWGQLDIITNLEIDCTTGNRWIEGTIELKHKDAVFYFDITLATLSYKFDCQEGEISYLNLIHEKDDDKMYLKQQVPHGVAYYVIDKPYPIESENLPLTFYIHHNALHPFSLHRYYILKINDITTSEKNFYIDIIFSK